MLKVSPINADIRDKSMYIKSMMEQSHRISPQKEKIRALGLLIYFLYN